MKKYFNLEFSTGGTHYYKWECMVCSRAVNPVYDEGIVVTPVMSSRKLWGWLTGRDFKSEGVIYHLYRIVDHTNKHLSNLIFGDDVKIDWFPDSEPKDERKHDDEYHGWESGWDD